MKTKLIPLVSIAFALILAALEPAAAQNAFSPDTGSPTATSPTRTDSRILYHNGPVLTRTQIVYFIWYGNWSTNTNQQLVLADFMSNLGSSPYFLINTGYPNSNGQAPSGELTFGGSAADAYSHGPSLSEADVADVVANAILTGGLPLDPSGIYAVLTTADVTVQDGATQFCLTCCNLHGDSVVAGSPFRYVFVGHPARCPGTCGAQPSGSQTANGDQAVDAMVSWLAHALNAVMTNPTGDGWYDRYGLENSEKCEGTYGTTYPVTNVWGHSTQANIKLGGRDYLLQQNWVNGKKGHCAMSVSQ
jgi:Phosphate-induced protein 1 conserved region